MQPQSTSLPIKSLTDIRIALGYDTLVEMFSDDKSVKRLADVKMFFHEKQITFYRRDGVVRYHHFTDRGDWIVKIADEEFLNRIYVYESDFCKLLGLPYQAPDVDTTVEEECFTDKVADAFTDGENIVRLFVIGSFAAMVGKHVYNAWNSK